MMGPESRRLPVIVYTLTTLIRCETITILRRPSTGTPYASDGELVLN